MKSIKFVSLFLLALLTVSMFAACQHIHSYGEWRTTKIPTCFENGEEVRFCDCGESQTNEIAKLTHEFKNGICENCGEPLVKEQILEFTSNNDGTCYVSGIGTWTDVDLVIPAVSPDRDTVVEIGEKAFYGNDRIKTVVIPDSVTYIGDSAFAECYMIDSIVIPDSVTRIGRSAFSYCVRLENIEIPNSVTSIEKWAFEFCQGLTNIKIPNSITSISEGVFYSCTNLSEIEIPNSVINIGESAFKDCSSLASIVIPNSVTVIGNNAFTACTGLTSIEIPNSVTSIGDSAFSLCENLNSVIIGNSVTSIGGAAFRECTALTIYAEAASQPSGWDSDWNDSNRPVVWGYFDKEASLGEIFTFLGYSFNEEGSMAVGFEINYEALKKYEEKTGETLEIGVVFAGYSLLNGNQPLDAQGNAITLPDGAVVKFDLTEYDYTYYDFIITDIIDGIKDIPLVISAYINNGTENKYIQENGISDTVTGISYNEANSK